MVEQSAVNRLVVGSSPTAGANKREIWSEKALSPLFFYKEITMNHLFKDLKKKQRIFFKMPTDSLQQYCRKYPLDSLSEGVMNHRFVTALNIMENCALDLSEQKRLELAEYIKSTFNRGRIVVAPLRFHEIYASALNKKDKKIALEGALAEFLAFAKAPHTPRKKAQLKAMVLHILPQRQERQATPFGLGMEEYRQRTCLFSR